MKNIFIDCGSNLGQGYEQVKSLQNIDSNWDVFMFEPNPNCFESLKKKYSRFENISIHKEGVYDRDGETEFHITTDLNGNLNKYSQGSKISETLNMFVDRKRFYGYSKPIKVKLRRLSKFVNSLESNNIILKIDVEGSEYAIINDLIEQGSFINIKHLYVEFHNNAIDKDKSETYNEQRTEIINFLKKNNVGFTEWH